MGNPELFFALPVEENFFISKVIQGAEKDEAAWVWC